MPRKRDYLHALDAQISTATLTAERFEALASIQRHTIDALKAAKAVVGEKAPLTRKPRKPKAVAVGTVDAAIDKPALMNDTP